MNKFKVVLITLFCIIFIFAILCRVGLFSKHSKYELIGHYPKVSGSAFVHKDIEHEGVKIGFVDRVDEKTLYFYIDNDVMIPIDSYFHEASDYKRRNYIKIRKGKSKENLEPHATIEYVDIMKKLGEKRRKKEEARKRQLSEQWQWLRDFVKELEKRQKELQQKN